MCELKVCCMGIIFFQVVPGMVERGRGTILFSGCSASLNGIAGYSELCKLLLIPSSFGNFSFRMIMILMSPNFVFEIDHQAVESLQ